MAAAHPKTVVSGDSAASDESCRTGWKWQVMFGSRPPLLRRPARAGKFVRKDVVLGMAKA